MDRRGGQAAAADESPSWWPTVDVHQEDNFRVTVATVNYNTRDLAAFLLWSLYRFIAQAVVRVVVIDNGSNDGSVEFLRRCADAGVCDLIANRRNRYHGPALNQAVSYLADLRAKGATTDEWVWLLDSDCVIAREDVVRSARLAANRSGAALIGETRWDDWHDEERLATFSLLFDPARVWHPPTEPFVEDGDPARAFELSCRDRPDLRVEAFPFSAGGYVIHRGRGTLARVQDQLETSNRYHAWSLDHHEAHYERVHDAERRYRDLRREFTGIVGNVIDADRLLADVTRRRQSA